MTSDDEIVINTLNQAQTTRKLTEKKNRIKNLKERKNLKEKNLKDKKKNLDKKSNKPGKKEFKKKETVKTNDVEPVKNDDKPQIKEQTKPTSRPQYHQSSNNHSSQTTNTSKAAKFSSLFKNNHEIPRVGDVEVKTGVKENIFSSNQFSALGLSAHLTDCLEKRFKLSKMTQIQEKAIPAIIDGKDCFVKSQTGSGKTLAYAIPIVQKLQSYEPRLKRSDGIRALVLVPTRELAIQTCSVFEQLCNACVWIVAGSLIGGMKKKSEKDRIRRGLNILVATPGRLCDHLDTTMALNLSKVEYLIFDEADRMLDMDFEKKINFIIFKIHEARKKFLAEPDIPKYKLDVNGEPVEDDSAKAPVRTKLDPQTILISATLTSGIKEIARRLNINDALVIDAADLKASNGYDNNSNISKHDEEAQEKVALPAGLTHYYMIVPSKLRLICLISSILDKFVYQTNKTSKLVIFASTNDSVQFHEEILSTFLNRKFNMYLDDDNDDEDSEFLNKKNKNSGNKICELFSLYGNMDQHKRAEILSKFCKATSGVLICTDVAARGLDMPNIDWIIQYNTPGSCVDYIHRVGRTARVGHKGKAVIFLEPCEIEYLKDLNKLGISLREIKIESAMDCLNDESKYYPRQMNSDRLSFAKNAEECANSIQFYIEEFVEKTSELQALARKAYLSFLRSYSCYSQEWKRIFHIKNLHIGHVAKSFGLREAPNQIVGNNAKLFSGSSNNNNRNFKRKTDRDQDNDPLSTKYARDLKRISNNHKEYGNVAKKNKLRSQKADLDLSGLLKNHRTVDEFSAGLGDESKANRKKTQRADISANSDEPKPKKFKIIKKNMSIFE